MENITLCGYVHIPGTRSRYVFNAVAGGPTAPGPFVETIQAGAFRQALRYRLRPDVRLLRLEFPMTRDAPCDWFRQGWGAEVGRG